MNYLLAFLRVTLLFVLAVTLGVAVGVAIFERELTEPVRDYFTMALICWGVLILDVRIGQSDE